MTTTTQADLAVELDDRTAASTRQLVDFATTTASGDVPADVLHESTRCLVDHVGLVIGASEEPAVRMARETALAAGPQGQALLMGTGSRVDVASAALVNGIAGHAFDFDDTHVPTILHPTTPLYAAGAAVAEWRRRSGRDLLAAHALGYEVGARASLALYPEHYDVGWHMTGTTGPLAAVTAASRLLGLDRARATHAVSVAATQAAGHREHFGTMTKPFHAGRAASSGVLAALLAERGFTGAPDPLEGRRGMFAVMSTRSTVEDLVDGLGSRWEVFRNGVKPYACGVVTHPVIDTVRQLRSEHGVDPRDVERIELSVHPLVLELTGKTAPRTGLEGKFSVTFACAVAMLDGGAGERAFSDANVARPDVLHLMARLRPSVGEGLTHSEAVAVAHLADGRQVRVHVAHASGTPENRLSDAALGEKFHELVDPVLGQARARELQERLWAIADVDDAGEVLRLAARAGA